MLPGYKTENDNSPQKSNTKYCRPAVSNEIIPTTRQEEVFFSKVAPV